MKALSPSFEILDNYSYEELLRKIEQIGRVCYKSENRITNDSSSLFVQRILKSGHESVIEHINISVKVICDRGISHEIVRHRIASYSQESTRYCNYADDKFGNELTFIKPFFWEEQPEKYSLWQETMELIEKNYNNLIKLGAKPEEARSILPNSLKTEIIMSMNLREWRHFFRLRASNRAHPQMREIAVPLLLEFKTRYPVIFEDVSLPD